MITIRVVSSYLCHMFLLPSFPFFFGSVSNVSVIEGVFVREHKKSNYQKRLLEIWW